MCNIRWVQNMKIILFCHFCLSIQKWVILSIHAYLLNPPPHYVQIGTKQNYHNQVFLMGVEHLCLDRKSKYQTTQMSQINIGHLLLSCLNVKPLNRVWTNRHNTIWSRIAKNRGGLTLVPKWGMQLSNHPDDSLKHVPKIIVRHKS